MRVKKHGVAEFDCFYNEIYGDRWRSLKDALLKPVNHVARFNLFADKNKFHDLRNFKLLGNFNNIYESSSIAPDFHEMKDENALRYFYFMDIASIYPVTALDVKTGHNVLDMCAAPGGKSLILAENLRAEGFLKLNDSSMPRINRLKNVLADYIPSDFLKNISIRLNKAETLCLKERELYDRILLDAPCSSERHLLHKPENLNEWSRSRTKMLAQRQYAMLSSAIRILKKEGLLVYSTCSISPFENDDNIFKLKKKNSQNIEIIKRNFDIGEPTELGWCIMPDKFSCGPIYFAIIRKIS
ncbi:MAG: hypothetical protein ACD_79C00682G0006 [uncultured bacterium]|nr:MAG: hypothetical protein ACD_79C00682G0006 [uncultured bacterium]